MVFRSRSMSLSLSWQASDTRSPCRTMRKSRQRSRCGLRDKPSFLVAARSFCTSSCVKCSRVRSLFIVHFVYCLRGKYISLTATRLDPLIQREPHTHRLGLFVKGLGRTAGTLVFRLLTGPGLVVRRWWLVFKSSFAEEVALDGSVRFISNRVEADFV